MSKVKIFSKPAGINKKLGKIKFEEGIDSKAIERAQKKIEESSAAFKDAVQDDYNQMVEYFSTLSSNKINIDTYRKVSVHAFSMKSRASTAGLPLASEVANILYKFCENAVYLEPMEGYAVLKLHFDALTEIFAGKFDGDNTKARKLINGLEAVVAKCSEEK